MSNKKTAIAIPTAINCFNIFSVYYFILWYWYYDKKFFIKKDAILWINLLPLKCIIIKTYFVM